MRRRNAAVVFAPGITEPGGAARRASLLTKGLAERGWKVRVIARAGTLRTLKLSRAHNLTIVEVPGFNRKLIGAALFLLIALPLGIIWGIRSRVFVAIQLFSQSWAASVCSLLLRKPYVVLGTISGASSEVDYVLGTFTAPLRRFLFRKASMMVAQTEEMASEMTRLVPDEKITILHNPVVRRQGSLHDERPRATYAGRLTTYKDLPNLLHAWARVVRSRADARLTLIGSGGAYGSVEDELRSMVENDEVLRSTVSFTGWVEDITPHLDAADVFVLPSTSEGMSNALVEACAGDRIVVASDIAPNIEVLGGEYPLLFRVGDTNDLESKLNLAFDNAKVREMSLRMIRERIKRHDIDLVVKQLEELLLNA